MQTLIHCARLPSKKFNHSEIYLSCPRLGARVQSVGRPIVLTLGRPELFAEKDYTYTRRWPRKGHRSLFEMFARLMGGSKPKSIESENSHYAPITTFYLGDIVDQGHPEVPVELDGLVLEDVFQRALRAVFC